MRDFYLVIDIIIALLLMSLSFAALARKGYRNLTHVLFAFFSVLIAIWIISNHISNDTTISRGLALIANYTVLASALAVVAILMLFIVRLAEANRLQRIASNSLPFISLVIMLCFTPLMVKNIEVQGEVYAISFGIAVWLYGLSLLGILIMIGYGLYHGLKHSSGLRRQQLLSITYGLAISLPLIITFAFVVPVTTGIFALTEFAITPTIILVISLYFSVVKYRLFDIRIAVVRTGAYVLSLVTLAAVYYVLAYLISNIFLNNSDLSTTLVSPLSIGLALILAFIFQPVKRFFDRITNRVFYKGNYNIDEFVSELNQTLSFSTDLRDMLRRAALQIGKTLKTDQAFFFVYTFDGHHVNSGTTAHNKLSVVDANSLFNFAYSQGGVAVALMLDDTDSIYRLMKSYQIEVALALSKSNQMVGLFCLGEHAASGYTNKDIKTLGVISNELVIAIENALSVEKIRELNSGLQQRINDATKELRASNLQLQRLDRAKDEFVSMASHQLRTPLTSVKGYISMVLEGDVGKISPNQKKLLSEAFNSSERMVHLINDFLNVSRLQTGKFLIEKTPVNLDTLIRQELDSLQTTAKLRGLKIIYTPPRKVIPTLMLDDSKIRQVVMNYVDNSIFYSPEKTDIKVTLKFIGERIIFTVKDSGIGVPRAERSQLFSKFYRASNARKQRPDGTGVGLFLAKKVIDAHGGNVIFESTEGKGSTFGFELFLSELEIPPTQNPA